MDYLKVRQWKYWTTKILVLFFSVVFALSKYWIHINDSSWGDILLLGLMVMVVNCCLIDLLIQLMNQYGICSAFNLIFFTDYLPTQITGVEQKNLPELLGWFSLTVLFIWITNLKWEVPVETNTLYNQDNKLAQKTTTQFGFKLNLSFMGFYQLSWIISYLYSIKIMWGEAGKNLPLFEKIVGVIEGKELKKHAENSREEAGEKSFGETFFLLNEEKNIFSLQEGNVARSQSIRLLGTFLLILLRGLANWLQVHMQWNPKEISQDLQKSGIYFDNVPPGRPTQKLLRKKVNELILIWYLIILVFHFTFDNIAGNRFGLGFVNWFSSVNLGTNLIQQIRTKYKYIQISK